MLLSLLSLQVYGPETTQREMFDGTVKSLVKDVLEGGNSLVFTYGVTNAGKTFTFLGKDSSVLLSICLSLSFYVSETASASVMSGVI